MQRGERDGVELRSGPSADFFSTFLLGFLSVFRAWKAPQDGPKNGPILGPILGRFWTDFVLNVGCFWIRCLLVEDDLQVVRGTIFKELLCWS